jgi:hypothetical protein
MFDRLVATAKIEGAGDLLEGLRIMDQDLAAYDDQLQAEFRHFMQLGARMFAPVDN